MKNNMDNISITRLQLMHIAVREDLIKDYNYINRYLLGKGVRLRITHTLRTPEEQHKLFLQRPKVTNADSWQSIHNYGLAFDIVILLDKDGDGNFESVSWDLKADNDKDGVADYTEVTKYLKSKGWTWGGDFKSISDAPHFEKTFGHTWKTLKVKYDKGETFTENNIKYVKL